MGLLDGKIGLITGVANKRSIAWAVAQAWHREGAKLLFTYQDERHKQNIQELMGIFREEWRSHTLRCIQR
jgi:enoyl-[acyl-carrier protein] reductase I